MTFFVSGGKIAFFLVQVSNWFKNRRQREREPPRKDGFLPGGALLGDGSPERHHFPDETLTQGDYTTIRARASSPQRDPRSKTLSHPGWVWGAVHNFFVGLFGCLSVPKPDFNQLFSLLSGWEVRQHCPGARHSKTMEPAADTNHSKGRLTGTHGSTSCQAHAGKIALQSQF